MLHQIKAQQFYTDLDSYQQCWVLQKIVEFMDFSWPLSDFRVLFKADLIFNDFSSKPSKFKYYSSLCEPCILTHRGKWWCNVAQIIEFYLPSLVAYMSGLVCLSHITNNIDPDQSSLIIFFASMKKSNLKCTWICAADVKCRQHNQVKN